MKSVEDFEVYKGKSDYMVVLENAAQVRDLKPDIFILSTRPHAGRHRHGPRR